MAWWLHLTNQAIQHLDILPGEPTLLSVWSRHDRVSHYDLLSGVAIGDETIMFPDVTDFKTDEWNHFIAELKAPNSVFFPVVHRPPETFYTTEDGKIRLYISGNRRIKLHTAENQAELDKGDASSFAALALDRKQGLSAVLDTQGKLHIFWQHTSQGSYDLNLNIAKDWRPRVVISDGGQSIFVSDGKSIVITNAQGQIRSRLQTHYLIYQMACAPEGKYILTSDMDTGVLRVYDGATLLLCYQRFAIDLVAEATQVQLLADLPPSFVAPRALAVDDEGVVAFAMSGIVCVSDVSHMDAIP